MSKIEGKYSHIRNENVDEYFKTIGVPYIPRKMMNSTKPSLEITNYDGQWTITTVTMLRTVVLKFKLGETYEERMPGGLITSTTVLQGDSLFTSSIGPNETKITRMYSPTDEGCVIIMKHEASGVEAKRYFKRN